MEVKEIKQIADSYSDKLTSTEISVVYEIYEGSAFQVENTHQTLIK